MSGHQIDKILVIELNRRIDVHDGGGIGGVGGTNLFKSVSKGFVHGWVLGGVKTRGEGGTMANADGVATGEGYHVGGSEVFGRKGGEDRAGVACRCRKIGEGCVLCGKCESIFSTQWNIVVWPT